MARALHRGREDRRDARAADREVCGRAARGSRPLSATSPPSAAEEIRLLEQHAAVLFDVDANGDLVGINEPDSDETPPRWFVARGRVATRTWFAPQVPTRTRAECYALAAGLPPWDGRAPSMSIYDPLRRALGDEATIGGGSGGPAFRFGKHPEGMISTDVVTVDEASAHLLAAHFPYTQSHLEQRSPVVGAVVDGRIVAACYSARKRPAAAEAGVDTIEPYRGRGFAPAVVARWARAAAEAGLEPLYSTSWENAASLAVARKLGLVAYADTYAVR